MLKYIAVGLSIPYFIFLFFYMRKGFQIKSRLLARLPYLLLFCATWSIIPNILKGTPFLVSNIFFFNGILRKLHTTGSTWGLAIIFFVFFSLFFIFAKHLGRQENELASLKKGVK